MNTMQPQGARWKRIVLTAILAIACVELAIWYSGVDEKEGAGEVDAVEVEATEEPPGPASSGAAACIRYASSYEWIVALMTSSAARRSA